MAEISQLDELAMRTISIMKYHIDKMTSMDRDDLDHEDIHCLKDAWKAIWYVKTVHNMDHPEDIPK